MDASILYWIPVTLVLWMGISVYIFKKEIRVPVESSFPFHRHVRKWVSIR